MVKIITELNIHLPKEFVGITENNFWRYLLWQVDRKELTKRIKTRFEEGAFAFSGYDDDHRPKGEVTTPLPIEQELEFAIQTELTTKRPAYSQVNDEFGNYLSFLLEQREKRILRRDVITIDGEPYVSISDLLGKLKSDLKTLLEGREGVSQSLKIVKPAELLAKIPQTVSIVFDRDYSALTDYNGRIYVEAVNLSGEGDKRAKLFKASLLEDSLKTIGVQSKKDLKEVVTLSYPFESADFIHQLEPRTVPSYGGILDAFIHPAPERIAINSKIGDFIKVVMMMSDDGLAETLRNKGLVNEEFVASYKPVRREENVYVRLKGVLERLKRYRADFITPTVEQNIILRPTRY